jgi:predicted PurR-regulated permease PerM
VSAVSVFLIVVVVLALAALIAFVIVMYQNTKRLARSVSDFQQEIQPIVDDIAREAEQASEHAAKLSEGIPGREPGDKIRR